MTDELKQWEYDKGYTKGYSDGRASLIDELEKIIKKIDFEEKWLFDLYVKEYKVSTKDIKIAMSGIRSVIAELKGEQE